jgi:hypothetical protein
VAEVSAHDLKIHLRPKAEPNAVGFYEKMAGTYRRESEQTSWGRTLDVMGVDLHG